MDERWSRTATSVQNINYHLLWCTKYRKKLLINEIEIRFKELLLIKAEELEITIKSMEVMSDHVHLFVNTKPTDTPHNIVKHLKGMTSKILREEHPMLKKRAPSLWTRSYYCESIGHISEQTITKYIEDQKLK